jgi:acetyltransferase-like isoleucine patch superfamily enzyme
LTGRIAIAGSVVGGVPARVIRPLTPEDEALILRKARREIPDDL